MPAGVTSLRVLCVGGGGSGAGSYWGGGGAGNVSSGTFTVTPGAAHTVSVGAGAPGGPGGDCYASSYGFTGTSSAFGALLSCSAGTADQGTLKGGNGGSGGGAGCWYTCTAGYGGTNGAAGEAKTGPNSGFAAGGSGQGSFAPHFALFTENIFSAGAGGPGVANPLDAGGSGGGGVIRNGTGPSGGDGAKPTKIGKGGKGYGAGGGSGGCDATCAGCAAGGNGAPGLVYVEWTPPRISFSVFNSKY